MVRAPLVLLPEKDLNSYEWLSDHSRVIKVKRMQFKLDLVQVLQVLPDLLVNVVELLVRVGSSETARLVLQELARVVLSRLEECPCKSLHHDDLGLLQLDIFLVCHETRVKGITALWLVLLLQLRMLDKRAFLKDLHEAIIHDLHLVWLEEMDWVIELFSTLQVLQPEGI